MSVFDNIGNKLSDIGGSIKQGATTFTETMQHNSNIERAKKDLKDIYTELGEKFFNDNKENVPEQYKDIFARIIEIECYIEATKQAMRELTGTRVCPNCKSEVQKGQLFCTVCGTKIEDAAPKTAVVYCKNCGQEIRPGFRFCTRCGTKVEDSMTQQTDDSLEKTQPVGYGANGADAANMNAQNAQAENAQAEAVQQNTVQTEAAETERIQQEPVQTEAVQTEAEQTETMYQESKQAGEIQEQRSEYDYGQAQKAAAEEISQPDIEQEMHQDMAVEMNGSAQKHVMGGPAQKTDMDGKIICPHCGAKIKAGTTFCIMCGARLRES